MLGEGLEIPGETGEMHRDSHGTENVDTKPTEPFWAKKTITHWGPEMAKPSRNQGFLARND